MPERVASKAVSTGAGHQPAATAPQHVQGPQPAAWNALLQLQRTAGNRVTQSLLAGSPIQAKLRIGPVGDAFEREADRVADEVVRSPESPGEPPRAAVPRRSTGESSANAPSAKRTKTREYGGSRSTIRP